MEGISFVTMVFFIVAMMGGHKSCWNQLMCVMCLCTCNLFLTCSSFNSYLISSFVCRITLNFLGRPTGCFYTTLWISLSCAMCFNKSISCCKMLKCSSYVMGFNNPVNMFYFFCWMPIEVPNYFSFNLSTSI